VKQKLQEWNIEIHHFWIFSQETKPLCQDRLQIVAVKAVIEVTSVVYVGEGGVLVSFRQ